MQPSTATSPQRLKPHDLVVRVQAELLEACSNNPASIHSSRRVRIVVAEQVRSPALSRLAPSTSTWSSLSNTTRSAIRGRWAHSPSGWSTVRSGRRAANWSHSGSMMKDGSAGTDASWRRLT